VDDDVDVSCFNPDNVIWFEKDQRPSISQLGVPGVFHDWRRPKHVISLSTVSPSCRHGSKPRLYAERLTIALGQRFQKVIDCLRGKGVDREAFMSCGKNDNGPVFGRQLREHLHSAAARHFHVEKDEITGVFRSVNCFGAAAAYADDLDAGLFANRARSRSQARGSSSTIKTGSA